ncbi:MAG: glutamine-hydrolyzing carbamoyl-phosphate synthase small subunit [Chitinophagales bacterium]|nr:glutamine-hydrolyzing carbamoyl-phosphate synthase small subunit [Bacteroidota bacterium]MCB9255952.1 glutamine-hydrolyzing carbamoyl-phosphate synthase small subunit [Chitinophagales bacterium]
MMNQHKAYLLLEDGTYYEGKALGRLGTTYGEICFNTGMTGYQEVFTDPSYFGQVVIMTNAHIGNYGAMDLDKESAHAQISGLIVKNFSAKFSRLQANTSLNDFLQDNNIVGISDLDTRALVSHVRSKGAMNCIISSDLDTVEKLKKELAKAPNMDGLELASKVSTQEAYTLGNENAPYKVAVLDLGIKRNMLNCLLERNFYLKVFPAKTSFAELKAFNADGYFISNGPGDPAAASYAVDTVSSILEENLPLFGICLGHQILARASGVSTYKMHHGHRGLNHPVKNLITGQCEITSQNHGFEVSRKDIETSSSVKITHENLNDGTVEGIERLDKKAFSVQYHPESSPGPHDSRYLFEKFELLMQSNKN